MADNKTSQEIQKSDFELVNSELKKAIEEIDELNFRFYSYSYWITNVSLGLLGFYIAFLIQIRSISELVDQSTHKMNLILLCVAISVGFIIRATKEFKDHSYTLRNFILNVIKYIETNIDNIVVGNKLIDIEAKEKIELIKTKIGSWGVRKSNYFPDIFIVIQFVILIFVIIRLVITLYKYLFH